MPNSKRNVIRAIIAPYAISLVLWALFALVIAGYYTAAKAPVSVRFGFSVFFMQLVIVLLPFALLTPTAFQLCQKLYQGSRSRLDWLVKNLGLCVLWYFTANALATPFELFFWYGDGHSFLEVLWDRNINEILSSVASFWIVAAAGSLASSFKERQQRATAIARVQAQLTEAKLQNLRYQLNPHFLFNSINAAVSFVRRQHNQEAERMLLALAELMDAYLSPQSSLTVALAEELELLQKYLEIETIRYGEKLMIEMAIAPGSEKVQVPSMLLQPLVENAVRHGIARMSEPGLFHLETRIEDEVLIIVVYNDVNEADSGNPRSGNGHGLGLSLTRRRLAETYGARASLEAGPGETGGYRVYLRLPLSIGVTMP